VFAREVWGSGRAVGFHLPSSPDSLETACRRKLRRLVLKCCEREGLLRSGREVSPEDADEIDCELSRAGVSFSSLFEGCNCLFTDMEARRTSPRKEPLLGDSPLAGMKLLFALRSFCTGWANSFASAVASGSSEMNSCVGELKTCE
jgi:hypothetical protein